MSNQIPLELNSDFNEFRQCKPCQTNSTFEPCHESSQFSCNLIENLLNQEDDDFQHNEKIEDCEPTKGFRPSLIEAFQADMTSYVSQQKLTKNSIEMQNEYREADPREREFVFNKYIKNDIFNLSKDTYMHYVLETILEVGPIQYRNMILDQLFEYREKLLLDLHSCKVMQKGLEIMAKFSSDSQIQQQKFINFILQDSDFNKMMYTHRIASQIIQKSLEVFDDNDVNRLLIILNQYILNENNQKVELATDQFGCLIVNKIIELHPKLLQKNNQLAGSIINRIIENSACLTRRQYANYIIQQLLEKGSEQFKKILLFDHLLNDFMSMSMDKYGSNVAEKAIIHSPPAWRQRLWEEQVSVSEWSIRNLVNDQFANFPIQKLYLCLAEEYRYEFLTLLHRLYKNNFLNHYGQIVLNFASQNCATNKFQIPLETQKQMNKFEKNKKLNNNNNKNQQKIQSFPNQNQQYYQQQQLNNQQQQYYQYMMMQQYYFQQQQQQQQYQQQQQQQYQQQQQQQQQYLYNPNPQNNFMQQSNSQSQQMYSQMMFDQSNQQQFEYYQNVFRNDKQLRKSQRD